jgi:hypothetical protein
VLRIGDYSRQREESVDNLPLPLPSHNFRRRVEICFCLLLVLLRVLLLLRLGLGRLLSLIGWTYGYDPHPRVGQAVPVESVDPLCLRPHKACVSSGSWYT